MTDVVQVVVSGETTTIDVTPPPPVVVEVADPSIAVTVTNPTVTLEVTEGLVQVDVSALGAPGVRGEPGAPGPIGGREVYLDDEPVQDGVTSWLRITRDPEGGVNGIYYGTTED